MRVLLDNCVPYRAKYLLTGHDASHAKDEHWERFENGKLLAAAAEAKFDVVLTVDKKMRNQQNLDDLPISVLEVDCPDSRLPEIQRLAPFILEALLDCRRYRFVSVKPHGAIERLAERRS